jgi:hypothetical protein
MVPKHVFFNGRDAVAVAVAVVGLSEAPGCALPIAGDWRGLTTEVDEFGLYCFSHGIFWVSTWGAGCEEAHDPFEWAHQEPRVRPIRS